MLYKYKWTPKIKGTQLINSLIRDLTFEILLLTWSSKSFPQVTQKTFNPPILQEDIPKPKIIGVAISKGQGLGKIWFVLPSILLLFP